MNTIIPLASIALLALFFNKKGENVTNPKSQDGDYFFQFDDLFKKYGFRYKVDWKMLKAIAMNESSLGQALSVRRGLEDPKDVEGSKSFDGLSWGLMQIAPGVGSREEKEIKKTATPERLNNPEFSIEMAAQLLHYIQSQFPIVDTQWEEWVVKSYNQGVRNTRREREGLSKGFTGEYWPRYKRNYKKIEERQG